MRRVAAGGRAAWEGEDLEKGITGGCGCRSEMVVVGWWIAVVVGMRGNRFLFFRQDEACQVMSSSR